MGRVQLLSIHCVQGCEEERDPSPGWRGIYSPPRGSELENSHGFEQEVEAAVAGLSGGWRWVTDC